VGGEFGGLAGFVLLVVSGPAFYRGVGAVWRCGRRSRLSWLRGPHLSWSTLNFLKRTKKVPNFSGLPAVATGVQFCEGFIRQNPIWPNRPLGRFCADGFPDSDNCSYTAKKKRAVVRAEYRGEMPPTLTHDRPMQL